MRYSLVVPIYNEEKNIPDLISRSKEVLVSLDGEVEIICVDDKSEDSSVKILKNQDCSFLRIIKLLEHSGQSIAMAAGFKKARGDIVIMLDADLQCVPEDIPGLLENFSGSCDSVCGIRKNRLDSRIKKISSWVGNKFRNVVTGENIKDTNCPLKAFKREAILAVPFFKGFHRFIPTLLKSAGYSVKFVPVRHFPRKKGKSKYGIGNRLFKGLVDVFGVRWFKKNSFNLKNITEEI
ncbi:MAG: glycosyltransferase family 2 protein [Elusimicrobiota bacterium]